MIEHGPSASVLLLETDHLGTPRAARNAAGTLVWQWESDAFGATPANEDPDGDGTATTINLRFPGQYYDKESGLHYNWHRYYDPRVGRYISADPIGLDGGLNLFGYVNGNPLSIIDPEGLAGAIPKSFGKGKPLPPPEKLPNDTNESVKNNQQTAQDQLDAWKCAFGLVACDALKEIQKALRCELSICTTCDGKIFYSGPKATQTNAFDPATTTCKCIQFGLDPNYQGGPPPGLTAPGR
ncbi:RHS repeat domain-containing protein [Dechloromonas denitrificans]|uniref:RHS repeat domain-containing protein n=1 Tax=Dechloromonas denitrificans TaxID=281362 RepID=UPI001CF91BDA|nr:RHS repeat-associated core domain-containing protein [Dechloromonas denitrificans]UCV03884.1 RHS domain-containing protein [Dechloromonas denitrificans]